MSRSDLNGQVNVWAKATTTRKVAKKPPEGKSQCCCAIEGWIASSVDVQQLFGDGIELARRPLRSSRLMTESKAGKRERARGANRYQYDGMRQVRAWSTTCRETLCLNMRLGEGIGDNRSSSTESAAGCLKGRVSHGRQIRASARMTT
jgi:hypothetical protein